MSGVDEIDDFLSGQRFAVAGASNDRSKYGNRVLRAYLDGGFEVTPVNPKEHEIEGVSCVSRILDLPDGVHGLSIVTPPQVGEALVEDAAAKGIPRVWFQPGAESPAAVRRATELGLSVIAGGPCVLVALRLRSA
jgi:predicted CoA-binding protein